MAGFVASTETEEELKKKKKAAGFRGQFCVVCDQTEADCSIALPRTKMLSRVKHVDWLDAFEIGAGPGGTGPKAPLYGNFMLPIKEEIKDIAISKDRISYDLEALNDGKKMILTALAMAVAAQSNKNMRDKGVKLEGTVREQVFLLLAAEKVGLKVTNAHPQARQQAQGMMKSKDAEHVHAAWNNFSQYMDMRSKGIDPFAQPEPPQEEMKEPKAEAPQPAPSPAPAAETATAAAPPPPPPPAAAEKPAAKPAPLTNVFARTLPDALAGKLASSKVSEDTYRKISEKVIQDQQASRKYLADTFKETFNLTNRQIDTIVEAMDQEGITSQRAGKSRFVNFGTDGARKPAAS